MPLITATKNISGEFSNIFISSPNVLPESNSTFYVTIVANSVNLVVYIFIYIFQYFILSPYHFIFNIIMYIYIYSCIFFKYGKQPTPQPHKKSFLVKNWKIIAEAGGGGFALILIIVIVVVCLVKRNKGEKDKELSDPLIKGE